MIYSAQFLDSQNRVTYQHISPRKNSLCYKSYSHGYAEESSVCAGQPLCKLYSIHTMYCVFHLKITCPHMKLHGIRVSVGSKIKKRSRKKPTEQEFYGDGRSTIFTNFFYCKNWVISSSTKCSSKFFVAPVCPATTLGVTRC